jgi:hypothetical protein
MAIENKSDITTQIKRETKIGYKNRNGKDKNWT